MDALDAGLAGQLDAEDSHQLDEIALEPADGRLQENAMQMVSEAEAHAKHLVSEQEIVARARMEVEETRQSMQEEIDKLYHDVYKHIDDVLAQLDRSISEKLTDIRATRQQIDQSLSPR